MHATLYCADVLSFARRFLELSGLGTRRTETRSLQQLQRLDDMEEFSLEQRNLKFLKGTFFNTFQAVREEQAAAGVTYAVTNTDVVRNEELALVYRLLPGNEQLLNGKESDANMSVWVSNHGFFYVLRSVPMVTHNKKFVTPVWTIKARGTVLLRCRGGAVARLRSFAATSPTPTSGAGRSLRSQWHGEVPRTTTSA